LGTTASFRDFGDSLENVRLRVLLDQMTRRVIRDGISHWTTMRASKSKSERNQATSARCLFLLFVSLFVVTLKHEMIAVARERPKRFQSVRFNRRTKLIPIWLSSKKPAANVPFPSLSDHARLFTSVGPIIHHMEHKTT